MKIFFANLLAIIHLVVVFIILFGWFIPELFYIQGLLLVATFLSWVFTGKCILTVWEFKLRDTLVDYEYGYIQYHARNLLKTPPSLKFIKIAGLTYLIFAIIFWLVLFYFGIPI